MANLTIDEVSQMLREIADRTLLEGPVAS